MSAEWLGHQECRHYKGVKSIIAKVCCGGKVQQKVKLDCAVHKHIYASSCRKEVCGYYEKGVKNV